MSTAAFIPLLHGQLAELRKISSSMWHGKLRERIAETEVYIQERKGSGEDLVLATALAPFFSSVETPKKPTVKLFQPVVLDCFYNVFKLSSPQFYPDRELTKEIVHVMTNADWALSDDINLKCCNVCIACLRSPSGVHFCHGTLLRMMFEMLFRIYNNSENPTTFNSIKTAIREAIRALFDSYESPQEIPQCKTVAELSEKVVSGIVLNVECLIECLSGYGGLKASIRDVDAFVVLSLMADVIENKDMKLRTVDLAAGLLKSTLDMESKFFASGAFARLVQRKIHVAVMSLALDARRELVTVTTELILILWRKFADLYVESLNEVLVKGLATALTSPTEETVSRTLAIYERLINHPQLFIDSFINYDCDDSGYFPNVFANTVDRIAKLACPNADRGQTQKSALSVLVRMIQQLWDYFDNFTFAGGQEMSAHGFLDAKRVKDLLENGLSVFKKSTKKGLAFFKEHGFIDGSPASIASFFFTNKALDPAKVGEIIGGPSEESCKILREFIAKFDFRGVTFECAFRQFLSSFQIPGEAQMIARVMEEFGQKFYEDNPTIFSCADTVYVLAYSALMLHTDAHHPNVSSRMTLQEFLSNNQGIDNGNDLPNEFMEDLYNGVRAKRIFCSVTVSSTSGTLLTRTQRASLFKVQADEALEQARGRNDAADGIRKFHTMASPLFISPMFRAVWGGVLAALTMTFEQSDDKSIYGLCLVGLTNAVHIASHCFVEDALPTLVDAFTKFTALRWKRVNEIKQKNIDCCASLFSIASSDGNFLRGSWVPLMDQISELDKIASTTSDSPLTYDRRQSDDLFTNSGRLDRDALVEFVAATCEKSREELQNVPPREFLLRKIGIITEVNVHREHFIWVKIWDQMSEYLTEVGSNFDIPIARLTIDILGNVACVFLKQEHLTPFEFHDKFTQPLCDIFTRRSDVEVKLCVLRCVEDMVSELAKYLRGGWSAIFRILVAAAGCENTQVVTFEIASYIVAQSLPFVEEHLIELIAIFQCFVENAHISFKLSAISNFWIISESGTIRNDAVWTAIFAALLTSTKGDDEVRKSAHEAIVYVLDLILVRGVSSNVVNGVITETLSVCFKGSSESPVFNSQAIEFAKCLFDVVMKFYDAVFCEHFTDLMSLVSTIILSEDSDLGAVGLSIMATLVEVKSANFDEEKVVTLIRCLELTTDKVFNLSLANKRAFVALLVSFVERFKQMRFIDLIARLDAVCCNQTDDHDRSLIWPYTRSCFLRAILTLKDQIRDQVAVCIYRTYDLYRIFGMLSLWDDDVSITLQLMNGLDDDIFEDCMSKASDVLVKLIVTQSLDVRKQIRLALKRTFHVQTI